MEWNSSDTCPLQVSDILKWLDQFPLAHPLQCLYGQQFSPWQQQALPFLSHLSCSTPFQAWILKGGVSADNPKVSALSTPLTKVT